MTTVQGADILRVLPEAVLSGFAVLVMVLDPFLPARRKAALAWLALAGVLAAEFALFQSSLSPGLAFNGTVSADPFSFYFIFLFLLIAAMTMLGSMNYLERDKMNGGEFYALVLLASVGACFMAASTELIMIFIGLEISSISTYILAGLRRHDLKSNEASLKYFLLGSFATAFFLYGVAFVYGLTGTTKLAPWSEPVPSLGLGVQGPGTHQIVGQLYHTLGDPSLMWVALILLFVGLAFKVSTVPFQVWTPDVYQGAPAPVTAFLSTGPKAAAFAVVLRLFVGGVAGFANLRVIWIVSAVLTMSLGNLAALRQSNLKRLLAYSAIAHAGYVLVGVAAAPAGSSAEGTSAVLFYLVAYSLMNLGAFLLLGHLAGAGEGRTDVEDYVGLAYRKPGVAACLSVFLLSLAGFPTTAGFLAKFYVFRAAIHAHLAWLIVIALLNSVISAYYYLRLVVVMYMREGKTEVLTEAVPWPLRAALAASVLGIFYLGLFPNLFLNLANLAASPLPYFGLPY